MVNVETTNPLRFSVSRWPRCRVRAFTRSSGWWLLVVIDTAEALLSCPCLQLGAIHGEVFIREQVSLACLPQYGLEERLRNAAGK
jgi:hypothetical protein